MRLADPLDQATGLRRLFTPESTFRAVGVVGPDARRNARVSAGLALALGRRGSQVLLFDEAQAPHNVASLLGIVARLSFSDAARAGHLAQAMQSAGDGVDLLPAHDGIATLAGLDEREAMFLADSCHEQPPQWLFINAAAGSGHRLAATADLRILALPGSRSHLAEAYSALKSAHTVWAGETWQVVVEGAEPTAAESLFASLAETAQRFLGVNCEYLGSLPRRREGGHPILAAQDAIGLPGNAGKQTEMGIMAERLAGLPVGSPLEFEQYWQRMWLFCRMAADSRRDLARNGAFGSARRFS